METLNFTRRERLDSGFSPCQTSDGTLFYVDNYSIFVIYKGEKIDANDSWEGRINQANCFGSSLFFLTAGRKIYKAIFRPPKDIQITFVRRLENVGTCHVPLAGPTERGLEREFKIERDPLTWAQSLVLTPFSMSGDEKEHYGNAMLLSKSTSTNNNAQVFVYRACDDPMVGIEVSGTGGEIDGCYPKASHRGKLIYWEWNSDREVSARALSSNIIIITGESGSFNDAYCNDDSPLVFFLTNNCQLHVLYTKTMDMKNLDGDHTEFLEIAGVYGGKIIVKGEINGTGFIFTAENPAEYFGVVELKNGVETCELQHYIEAGKGDEQLSEDRPIELEEPFETTNEMMEKNLLLTAENEELTIRVYELERRLQEVDHVLTKWPEIAAEMERMNEKLKEENEEAKLRIEQLEKQLSQRTEEIPEHEVKLLFNEQEVLNADEMCFQTENGTHFYFEEHNIGYLYTNINGNRVYEIESDLSLMDGISNCSFNGVVGELGFFSSLRGKNVEFYVVSLSNDRISFEKINEVRASNISLLPSQPFFTVELAKEWLIYRFDENLRDSDGAMFDISEVNHLRKFESYLHRGILYLFRENESSSIEKVNEKVVKVQCPLFDSVSFHIREHSDFIYVLNPSVETLLVLNTLTLTVSELHLDSPRDYAAHSIVGMHNGLLTMRFQPSSPSRPLLMTTQLPDKFWKCR